MKKISSIVLTGFLIVCSLILFACNPYKKLSIEFSVYDAQVQNYVDNVYGIFLDSNNDYYINLTTDEKYSEIILPIKINGVKDEYVQELEFTYSSSIVYTKQYSINGNICYLTIDIQKVGENYLTGSDVLTVTHIGAGISKSIKISVKKSIELATKNGKILYATIPDGDWDSFDIEIPSTQLLNITPGDASNTNDIVWSIVNSATGSDYSYELYDDEEDTDKYGKYIKITNHSNNSQITDYILDEIQLIPHLNTLTNESLIGNDSISLRLVNQFSKSNFKITYSTHNENITTNTLIDLDNSQKLSLIKNSIYSTNTLNILYNEENLSLENFEIDIDDSFYLNGEDQNYIEVNKAFDSSKLKIDALKLTPQSVNPNFKITISAVSGVVGNQYDANNNLLDNNISYDIFVNYEVVNSIDRFSVNLNEEDLGVFNNNQISSENNLFNYYATTNELARLEVKGLPDDGESYNDADGLRYFRIRLDTRFLSLISGSTYYENIYNEDFTQKIAVNDLTLNDKNKYQFYFTYGGALVKFTKVNNEFVSEPIKSADNLYIRYDVCNESNFSNIEIYFNIENYLYNYESIDLYADDIQNYSTFENNLAISFQMRFVVGDGIRFMQAGAVDYIEDNSSTIDGFDVLSSNNTIYLEAGKLYAGIRITNLTGLGSLDSGVLNISADDKRVLFYQNLNQLDITDGGLSISDFTTNLVYNFDAAKTLNNDIILFVEYTDDLDSFSTRITLKALNGYTRYVNLYVFLGASNISTEVDLTGVNNLLQTDDESLKGTIYEDLISNGLVVGSGINNEDGLFIVANSNESIKNVINLNFSVLSYLNSIRDDINISGIKVQYELDSLNGEQYITYTTDLINKNLQIVIGNNGTKSDYLHLLVNVEMPIYNIVGEESSLSFNYELYLFIYVAVERVEIDKNVLYKLASYEYDSLTGAEGKQILGYYDLEKGQANIISSVYPSEASYYLDEINGSNYEFITSSDILIKKSTSGDLISDGFLSTDLSFLLYPNSYSYEGFMTFKVSQFGKTYLDDIVIYIDRQNITSTITVSSNMNSLNGEKYIYMDYRNSYRNYDLLASGNLNDKELLYIITTLNGEIINNVINVETNLTGAKLTLLDEFVGGSCNLIIIPKEALKSMLNLNDANFKITEDNIQTLLLNGNNNSSNYKIIKIMIGRGTKESPYHISSAKEFMDISNSQDSHYVLTTDIDLSAIQENIKNFNGSITSYDGNIYNVYGINLSQNYSLIENNNGSISNINFYVNFDVNAINSSNLNQIHIGLIAKNNGEVKDCLLNVSGNIYISSETESFVGMLVAENLGEIIYTDKTVVAINGSISIDYSTICYIGGVVGKNSAKISGVLNDSFSISELSINVGKIYSNSDSYIGAVVGLNELGSINSLYVGGEILGYYSNKVDNINVVTGADNIGGLIGKSINSSSQSASFSQVNGFYETNSVANFENIIVTTLIQGRNSVAGITSYDEYGYYKNVHYEIYAIDEVALKGENIVAGFIANAFYTSISYSSVYSYRNSTLTNPKTDIEVFINSENNAVGMFIANGQGVEYINTISTNSVLSSIASNLIVNISSIEQTNNVGTAFGSTTGEFILEFSMFTGFVTLNGDPVDNISNNANLLNVKQYISLVNGTQNVNFANGTYTPNIDIFSTERFGFTNSNDLSSYYLIYEGKRLLKVAPTSISLDSSVQLSYIELVYKYYDIIKTNEVSSSKFAQDYNSINTYDLPKIYFTPDDCYQRLYYMSSNSSVVQVLSDGRILLKGEGVSDITIYSVLDASKFVTIKIYVRNAIDDFDIYQSENSTDATYELDGGKFILTKQLAKKVITSFSNVVEINNTIYYYQEPILSGVKYDFALNCKTDINLILDEYFSDLGVDFESGKFDVLKIGEYTLALYKINGEYELIVVETNDDSLYLNLNDVGNRIFISCVGVLPEGVSIKVNATPFDIKDLDSASIESKYEFYKNLTKSFEIETYMGVTNISSNVGAVQMAKSDTVDFDIKLSTDTAMIDDLQIMYEDDNNTDEIYLDVKIEGQNIDLIKGESVNLLNNESLDLRNLFDSKTDEIKFSVTLNVATSYNGKDEIKATISFKSLLYETDIDVYIVPQSISRLKLTNYEYTNVNGSDEVVKSGALRPSANSKNLLTIELAPDNAEYAYLRITDTTLDDEKIWFEQWKMKENGTNIATDLEPYGTLDAVNEGIILRRENNTSNYYVKIYVSDQAENYIHNIKVTPYDESGNAIYGEASINVEVILRPSVSVSYEDPKGTVFTVNSGSQNTFNLALKDDVVLNVSSANCDNVSAFISSDSLAKYYTLDKISDEIYKLSFNDNVLTEYELNEILSGVLDVSFVAEKTLNNVYESTTTIISFDIRNMVIHGISIENYNDLITADYNEEIALRFGFNEEYDFTFLNNSVENNENARMYLNNILNEINFSIDYLTLISDNENIEIYVDDSIENTKVFKNANSNENIAKLELKSTGIYFTGLSSLVNECSLVLSFDITYDSTEQNVGMINTDWPKLISFDDSEYSHYNINLNIDLSISNTILEYNAKPIYDANDFINMTENKHYIQMQDIVLENYSPIEVNLKSFDGNGYKIIIKSIDLTEQATSNNSTANIGLFRSIPENMVVQNVSVYYASLEYNINATISADSVKSLGYYLDYSCEGIEFENKFSRIYFGGITAENNGVITNCSVGNFISTSSNFENSNLIQYYENHSTSESLSSVYLRLNYFESDTIVDLIPLFAPSISPRNFFVGGLVATNNGFITNSSVGASIKALSYLGGFVYSNTGKISSSKFIGKALVKTVPIENGTNFQTDNGIVLTSMFAIENRGQISLSYAGLRRDSGAMASIVDSTSSAVGFVDNNSGQIYDSYCQGQLKSSAYSIGFVNNNSGNIKNSYALISFASTLSSSGDNFNNIEFVRTYSGSTFENCYFFKNTGITSIPIAGVTGLSLNAFKNIDNFNNFISSDNSIWLETSSNGQSVSTVCGPLLISADEVFKTKKRLLSTTSDTSGNITYTYVADESNGGARIGSNENPYIIYDSESFNYYLTETASSNVINRSYRIVADIDLQGVIQPVTCSYTFSGRLEGNNMKITNFSVYTKEDYDSIGLFKEIVSNGSNTMIRNLTLSPESFTTSKVKVVGILAGIIDGGKIYNINLDNNELTVVGGNVVGGLAGIIKGNFVIDGISSNISINSQYRNISSNRYNSYNSKYVQDNNFLTDNAYEISYAGSIAGIVDGYIRRSDLIDENSSIVDFKTLNNLQISGQPTVIGENAGFISGFVGENSRITNAVINVNNNAKLKGVYYSAMVVAENRGIVDNVVVEGNLLTDIFDSYSRVNGGVAGLNLGGLISNTSVNDLYILSSGTNTTAGLIAGRNLGGSIAFNSVNLSNEDNLVLKANYAGFISGADYSNPDVINSNTTTGVSANYPFNLNNINYRNILVELDNIVDNENYLHIYNNFIDESVINAQNNYLNLFYNDIETTTTIDGVLQTVIVTSYNSVFGLISGITDLNMSSYYLTIQIVDGGAVVSCNNKTTDISTSYQNSIISFNPLDLEPLIEMDSLDEFIDTLSNYYFVALDGRDIREFDVWSVGVGYSNSRLTIDINA